jgi:hypothetical protein
MNYINKQMKIFNEETMIVICRTCSLAMAIFTLRVESIGGLDFHLSELDDAESDIARVAGRSGEAQNVLDEL